MNFYFLKKKQVMTFEEAKSKGGMQRGMSRLKWGMAAFVVGKPVRRIGKDRMALMILDGTVFIQDEPVGESDGFLSVGHLGYDAAYVPTLEDLATDDWGVG